MRGYLEIPAIHPTITECLVVEIADVGGPIDVYWGMHYFNHVSADQTGDFAGQFRRVLDVVESCLDPATLMVAQIDAASGRCLGWSRRLTPPTREEIDRLSHQGTRLVWRSWRGLADGEGRGQNPE